MSARRYIHAVLSVIVLGLLLPGAAQARIGVAPGTLIGKAHETCPLLSVLPPNSLGPLGDGPAGRIADTACILAAPPVTQAGAHPDATGAAELTGVSDTGGGDVAKDVIVETPPGFVGNLPAVPPCTDEEFQEIRLQHLASETMGPVEGCSPASQVGVVTLHAVAPGKAKIHSWPIYRLTTTPGYIATFGFPFQYGGFEVVVNATLRTEGDYGITLSSTDIPAITTFEGVTFTLWGVPGSPAHNEDRWNLEAPYEAPSAQKTIYLENWGAQSGIAVKPFTRLPTDCNAGPLKTRTRLDSWNEPGVWVPENPLNPEYTFTVPATSGCEKLHFRPKVKLQPAQSNADSPTGVSVQIEVPQDENPAEPGTPDLKRAVVTLPEGMSINPAAADGLQGCSPEQIGLLTTDGAYPNPIRFRAGAAECPQASKLGVGEIVTPALEETLPVELFLATPYENPFHSLFAIYMVITGPGFTVKLPGKVEANPVTGQLTTTFNDSPQLPFERLTLNFFGGDRAPLATPETCGVKTIATELEPWSAPQSGPPATPSSQYTASEGPGGGACAATLAARPFSPGLIAGSENPVAGATSGFELQLTREDGEQELAGLTVKLPPGLTAYLKGVPFCSEEAIAVAATRSGEYEQAHPDCPAASEVGHLLTGVGAGPSPLYIEGKVYLAGPYKGAPLSLVTITPALAGGAPGHPLYDLGTVVVRVAVYVNPETAQITAVSDPIPQILDGVPLRVRDVRVMLNRPNWMLNPTSCEPSAITAQATGQNGASASLANRFQVTACASLTFKPGFTASTSGKTSKADGASLKVKVQPPAEGSQSASSDLGSSSARSEEANIRSVKVELPKQLPSRLTTLQKACTRAQFDANPAGCPAASVVGYAKALTPILPVPLEGPAYFVSNGGEAFPNLIMVLQGYGLTIDLVGDTFISKTGVTSSTFKAVPDQPVSSFELTLPQGKYSALAANADLCQSKLAMPTVFVAQNGLEVHESTPIDVTGCARALTRVQKLAAALKVCEKRPKGKRAACRAEARKRYGPVTKTKSKRGAKKKK